MAQEYFCKYINAHSKNKEQSGQLVGSNSLVGAEFKLEFDVKNRRVIINNHYNHAVAEVENDQVDELILLKNKGHKIRAILSYVAYCEPKSRYLAEFLVIAYDWDNSDVFKNFCDNIKGMISVGMRPSIEFDKYEINQIIQTHGAWRPNKMLGTPKFESGTVLVKSKQSLLERIIEAGREKKPGCYFAAIIFLIIIMLIVSVIFVELLDWL